MRIWRGLSLLALLIAAACVPFLANVQSANVRAAFSRTDQLGKVNFPVSCAAAQDSFTKGVALLHSFQYQEASMAFGEVAKQDPGCAMAHWGLAMALYHQLWDWPSEETLRDGRQHIEQAKKLGAKTERERRYIAAAAVLYQENKNLDRGSRVAAYSAALAELCAQFPEDVDAGAFYALSIIANAAHGEQDTANRKKAIEILNKLGTEAPGHPGVAHYLIHAADTPGLASQGLDAARSYAKIAPDSSHALHMPSHIFVRLGLWQESIDSNLAAAAAAAKATEMHHSDAHYQFHAMDFLDYSYLQSGQEQKARQLVSELKDVKGASKEDIADFEGMFGARNALEAHDWKAAASLTPPSLKLYWQDTTYWAKSIGAARAGDAAGARAAVDKLKRAMDARPHEMNMRYGPNSGPSLRLQEAEAWLAYVERKSDHAIQLLRAAADQEDAEGVDSLAIPAREMLADMLLELKRPNDALVEYSTALRESPNRFDSLYGAAQAAQLNGNSKQAREYYERLLQAVAPAADRPEIQVARIHLAKN